MVFLSTFLKSNFSKIPSTALGIFFSALLVWVSVKYPLNLKSDERFIPPPNSLVYLQFGMGEIYADSLWVRAIQDFDYCEKNKNDQCLNNSWLFQMLDVATNISAKFRMVYVAGAINLSVLLEDKTGATALFEKGLKQFPDDVSLLYKASYHYLFELNEPLKAAELLRHAAKNGGPFWFNSLANRLYVDSGRKDLAESLIQEMIHSDQDPKLIERMKQKLNSAKKSAQ